MPAGAAGPACQIVIGSCHRPPLSMPDNAGILDRIAIEAFRRVGLKACIEPLPCERSLLNADGGQIDGDILRVPAVIEGRAGHVKRYPNLVVVPETLYPLSMTGFTLRDDLTPKTLDDLTPLRVGFILGWKILEDGVKAADTLRVRGPEALFSLLKEGKADVVIYDRLTGQHLIKALELKGIRTIEPPFVLTQQSMVLHRRHQQLALPLAAALRAMKADGSYADAYRRAGYQPPPIK